MARAPRLDFVGAWQHIWNRALAKRSAFETDQDMRRFMLAVALCVRAGLIEVHAYSILSNHFHLLVRSLKGEVSRALKLIQAAYVRYFNRTRKRNGPLFQGRFGSRLIEDERHWMETLAYVDRNPVRAGLVSRPAEYRYGSSRHHSGDFGRPWLSRRRIAEMLRCLRRFDPVGAEDYDSALEPYGRPLDERRVESFGGGSSRCGTGIEELLSYSPAEILNWMESRAQLADGTSAGIVFADYATVLSLTGFRTAADAGITLTAAELALSAGLLRDACGLGLRATAMHLGTTVAKAQRACARYAAEMKNSPEFAEAASMILHDAIRHDYPPIPPDWALE